MGLGPLEPEVLIAVALLLLAGAAAVIWWIAVRISVRRKTREVEKKLAAAEALRESAEASNRAKADFLASMSHEIRTPMNAIVGFTDLALKSDISPELRDYLDTVHTSAEWLMHIVNDVLEFSRVEAGRLQLDNTPFSVADCIQSAVKIVQPEAAAKGLAVRSKIDPQIPAQVCGDFTRLRQVIFNLVSNAVKFTASGSVMISAGLESKSEDAVLVRIAVADTGIGIPLHKREFIFEPFRPAEQNPNGMTGGTGLGLAISHKMVTMMGGTMEFQSQLGAGSTFQFTAWFQKPKAAAEIEEPAIEAEQSGPKLLSILVAEDNAVNCRLITKVLESAGHRVRSVANGREAARVCDTEAFDLLLMDMEMPEIDGLEATEMIRSAEPPGTHVPIYALTAHILPGDREKCFAVGMDGFISKPIAVDDVLRLVADVASGHPQRSYVSLAAAMGGGDEKGESKTDDDGIPSQYKKKASAAPSEEEGSEDSGEPAGKGGSLFQPEYGSEEESAKSAARVNGAAEGEFSEKREAVKEMPAGSSIFKDPEEDLSPVPVWEGAENTEPETASEVQMTEALMELPKAFYRTEDIRSEPATAETNARAADMERNGSLSESRSGATVEVSEPASIDSNTRENLSVAAGLALLETSSQAVAESATPARREDRFRAGAAVDPFAQARASLSKARFDIRVIHSDGDPSERNLI